MAHLAVGNTGVEQLRPFCADLLRQRRQLLGQVASREQSCTQLLSENLELRCLQAFRAYEQWDVSQMGAECKARLLEALGRCGLDLEQFLAEEMWQADARKLRMAQAAKPADARADKQLEDELKEMHAVVSDQQKRIDMLLKENERLRQGPGPPPEAEAEAPQAPAPLPPPPDEPSEPAVPPGGLSAEPRQRPWPLRTVRKAVAPLRPAEPEEGSTASRAVVVRLMPGAVEVASGRRVEKIQVTLSAKDPARAVRGLVLEAGLRWPDEGGAGGLAAGQLLLHGQALDLDAPLPTLPEGAELRLVRQPNGRLRCQALRADSDALRESRFDGFHAASGPRGLLMSGDPWEPRKAAVDFFDAVGDKDIDHMSKILLAKPLAWADKARLQDVSGSRRRSTAARSHTSATALRGAPATKAASASSGTSGTAATGATLGALAGAAACRRARRVTRHQQAPKGSTATAERLTGDLSGALPDCPGTIWDAESIDVKNLPAVKQTAPLIIDAKELKDLQGSEQEWFAAQREKIMKQLQEHGAIWFRNFESTQEADGFRAFYESLQLNPCLDPIHTSGLRAMEEKKHAVYEAVNKPSLAGHFVGLHNESTFVKTATYGAFVCFEPASEGGGEFLIADGAKILKAGMRTGFGRGRVSHVRISVSNLDLNFLGALPEGMRESAADFFQDLIFKVVAPKFDMDLEMVYGADNSNPYRLQAIEHAQSPINKHPVTKQPVWFCNLHNHSRYLRDRRPCTVPEVGMTDVYSGDLSTLPYDDVRHINEVCERNIERLLMQKGDVVLLDNYRVLHGRDTFKGDRKHAVTWFESCGEPLQREKLEKPDDFMNELINKTLV
ncbi:unnamed protein product [Effrenium voratum]|nr:unnamed protein product [Effrenium voratum]